MMRTTTRSKSTKRCVLFFAILFLLIFIPGTFLTPSFVSKHNLGVGRNAVYSRITTEPANTIDVMVMGDSESYSSISPMQIWKEKGYTVYAAGQPGANLGDTISVLQVALKTQKPKVILLESHSLFRDRKGRGVQKQSAFAEKLYSLFPVLRYHNSWKIFFPQRLSKHYMGFNVSGKCKPYRGQMNYMIRDQLKNKVDAANIQDLETILKICHENKIQLMIYSAPSPKNYNHLRTDRIKGLCVKYKLKYLDLNEHVKDIGINWQTDTRDRGDHLNISGAIKTTTFIEEYLEQNFALPDHRKDDRVAKKWNLNYQAYELAVEKNLGKIQKKIKDTGKEVCAEGSVESNGRKETSGKNDSGLL